MADHDVIIIGAGGGGPVAAKELAEQGLRVLHLEAGPHHDDPERDFTHSESDMANVVSGTFRWGPGDRSRSPWVRRMVGPGLITQIAGVGGTTLHYYGNSPRAYPLAVERGNWPMSYDSLIPYYERVETLLPAIRDPNLPTKDAWVCHGAAKLGYDEIRGRDVTTAGWRPQYNAILPPGYAGPGTGCNQCGHCYEGCMHPHGSPVAQKAKRSTNISYVPLAADHDGYQLVTDAFVTRILTREDGGGLVADGVEWRDVATGDVHAATAPVVILAAGCVESPRLWKNSGLPDPHDVVGRYLTLHWFDYVIGTFDHVVHPEVGQNSQSRIEFPGIGCLETAGNGAAKSAFANYTFSRSWGADDNSQGEPWDTRGHLVGDAMQRAMDAYERSVAILVLTDDEISRDNRVTTAGDWPEDEHGPVPQVAYTPTPESDRRRDELSRHAADILRSAGARRVHRADWPALYLHMQSSMRMGRDPRTSVVDGNQESWQVKGLYITDASSLPDGLGSPNPTLTNQMFATRTAEHIAVSRFDREPFVASGGGRTAPAGFGPGEHVAAPGAAPGSAPGHADGATGGGASTLPATGGGSVVVSAAAITAAWALRRRERAAEQGSGQPTAGS